MQIAIVYRGGFQEEQFFPKYSFELLTNPGDIE